MLRFKSYNDNLLRHNAWRSRCIFAFSKLLKFQQNCSHFASSIRIISQLPFQILIVHSCLGNSPFINKKFRCTFCSDKSRLGRNLLKNLSDKGPSSFNSRAEQCYSGAKIVPKPGGGLECNLTGRCPFSKRLHNPFRKKICILIACFGIFRLQNNRKTIWKTIAYCS